MPEQGSRVDQRWREEEKRASESVTEDKIRTAEGTEEGRLFGSIQRARAEDALRVEEAAASLAFERRRELGDRVGRQAKAVYRQRILLRLLLHDVEPSLRRASRLLRHLGEVLAGVESGVLALDGDGPTSWSWRSGRAYPERAEDGVADVEDGVLVRVDFEVDRHAVDLAEVVLKGVDPVLVRLRLPEDRHLRVEALRDDVEEGDRVLDHRLEDLVLGALELEGRVVVLQNTAQERELRRVVPRLVDFLLKIQGQR